MNIHDQPRPAGANPTGWEVLWTAVAIAAGILVLWFVLHGGNADAGDRCWYDCPPATTEPEPTETTWPDTTSVTEAPTPTEPPGTTSTSPETTSAPPASTLPTSSTSSPTPSSSISPTTSPEASPSTTPSVPSSSTVSVAPPPPAKVWDCALDGLIRRADNCEIDPCVAADGSGSSTSYTVVPWHQANGYTSAHAVSCLITPPTPAGPQLPTTGSTSGPLIAAAMAAAVLGAILAAVARRRPEDAVS